jgi:two-component system, cell cycle sensor histidine kinase and response regulator CckA
MPQNMVNKASLAKVMVLLLVLLGLDLLAGVSLFQAQQQQHRHLIEEQLTAITTLKVQEITAWRQRMVDEADLLTESPFFARGMENYLGDASIDNTRALLQSIRGITSHYHYPGVLILSPGGETLVGYGPFSKLVRDNELEAVVNRAMNERRAVLSDLFTDDRVDGIFLAVAAPLLADGQSDGRLLGGLVLICDPDRYLFPFIQNWPIPSSTAESLLFRGDGDDVLYLSHPRHKPGRAMQLRIPLMNSQVPSAAAASGRSGIFRGVDYRGEKVIAHLKAVPGSPWHLQSKIDEQEAFAAWHSQSRLLILAFAGIAALLVTLGLVVWQRNRRNYYHYLYAAEQQLRLNAERSGVILRGIAEGIIVTNGLGQVELLNPAAENLIGWQPGEAIGKPLAEILTLVDEKSGISIGDPLTTALDEAKHTSLETASILIGKDGRKIAIAHSAAPLHDAEGIVSGAVLVIRDQNDVRLMQRLTEKRLDIILFANTHNLDLLIAKVLDEICELVDSPIGFFHFVEADQQTLSLQQWSTRTLREFCQAEGKGRHYDIKNAGVWVDCLRQRKPVVHNDYPSLPHKKGLPEGHVPIVRELLVPVIYNDLVVAILGVGNKSTPYTDRDVETVLYLAEMVYHVIEAKRVDQRLRESLQASDDLVRTIPSGLFIYQHRPPDRLTLLSGNPEASRLTGKCMEEIVGLDFDTIWPTAKAEGITDHFLRVMATGETFESQDLRYADDNLIGAFRLRAFVLPGLKLAVAFENISELKKAEAEREKVESQLRQAQKMESVGRLAGGVAHDFNNMLSVIIGNAEMGLEHAKNNAALHRELEEIKKAALRSAELTRQLLAFARKQAVTPKLIDLNPTIEGMLRMLRRLIGEDIQLTWAPQTGLAPIFIDPSQIDQILANLCVNARDAIQGLGQIVIETSSATINAEYCWENPGFIPGDYTCLSCSDNGSGIPKDQLQHIFEPFFTTKRQGEGTGLGLSMIYGIVKQNGGFVKVYSEPGQGTTFRIYLPQYAGETAEVTRPEEQNIPTGQGELILLVEDETVILELNSRMLERLGYQVLATSSATEAILLAREHQDQLRLLLTDIIMPEMNGHDLAKAVWRITPELKCLFMSGYTANVISRQGFLPEGINFLQKPFMKSDLARKLRHILDEVL